jgi:probable F420-dependent oxidoreductase
VKFGVGLGRLNPAFFIQVTEEADRLGFESAWLPEHLIFPAEMSGSPYEGAAHPPVPPTTPIFDAFAYLAYLAGRTQRIRLGTYVYNLALRHPFVAARAVQTLDIVSGGRADVGIGASWLAQEWEAVGLDWNSRGRRLDEALEVCVRLWTEKVVEHRGEFFNFDAVMFEPKPIQQPHPPVHVGGDSAAAMRRAARSAQGWVPMNQTMDTIGASVQRLRRMLEENGRGIDGFQISLGGRIETRDDVKRAEDAGVTRLIVTPWPKSPQAIDGIRRFADTIFD